MIVGFVNVGFIELVVSAAVGFKVPVDGDLVGIMLPEPPRCV